jgi:hypothetical protein
MTTETEALTVAEIDCSTNTISYRPMTDDEIVAREASAAEFATYQAEREAARAAKDALKESAKAKLVAGEPLTEEEASVLVI